jgi:hypothetical protein
MHLPAQLAPKNINGYGLAYVRSGGNDGRSAQQGGNVLAVGISPAHMPR